MSETTGIKLKPDCELAKAIDKCVASGSSPYSEGNEAEARAHLLDVIWNGYIKIADTVFAIDSLGPPLYDAEEIANEIMGCEQ